MNDLMLDLETLGTNSRAPIVQIGAVYFDPATGELGESFLMNITLESAWRAGGIYNPETILWWLQQEDIAIKSVFGKHLERHHIDSVLDAFTDFSSKAKRIWSHATFDFVVLDNAYRAVRPENRISYRKARDIRTLVALSGIVTNKIKREGVHHNALDDCLHQVKYCSLAYQALIGRRDLVKKLENALPPLERDDYEIGTGI